MEDENNLEKLQTLVEFLKANGIAEYESEQGDTKLRIKFASTATPATGFDAGQLAQFMAPNTALPTPAVVAHAHPVTESPVESTPLHVVKSPIVGTFYDSPSP